MPFSMSDDHLQDLSILTFHIMGEKRIQPAIVKRHSIFRFDVPGNRLAKRISIADHLFGEW